MLAIYLSAIAVSIVAAFMFKRFIKPDVGDTLLGSIIFIPTILIWAQSQNLSELAGFGLTAKFSVESQKKVSSVGVDAKELTIFSLVANDPNFAMAAYFESCAEYFVLRPSKVPQKDTDLDTFVANTSHAIQRSITCGKLVGVVVLDDNDKYIGSYDKAFFSEALSMWAVPDQGNLTTSKEEISKRIQRMTIFGASLRFPDKRIVPGEGFVAAINEDATIQTAFLKFRESDVDFLVMTNATGKFRGIIRYRDVVDSLLSILIDVS